jgi:quinohemoprotein amine dehydrogenase
MTHRLCALPLALAAGLLAAPPAAASEELLAQVCGECHEGTDAGLSRVAGQRKTPEGWLMTIVRMRIAHGMEISSADQAALVAWLAETQGLAPSETEGWRYALEKDPAVVEALDEPLGSMCARCHTGARVMLQHRTPEEWTLHMDFHVGQFPTIEYQALGRDRDWYQLAKDEIAPLLAGMLPYETEAWTAWQAAEKPEVAGDWVVLTSLPGKGAAHGVLSVAGTASPYAVSGSLMLADGTSLPVGGQMNLYTGYEWRANLTIGGESYRQVLAVSEDGAGLEGRQFLTETDSLGGRLTGAKAGAGSVILGTVPEALPAPGGAVQVVGTGLDALAAEGAELAGASPNASGVAATVTAGGDGIVALSAGGATGQVAVYSAMDRLAVEPAFAIARVGGGSDIGPDAVPIDFAAVGYWNGPDGQPGTEDDIRIGEVPASWSSGNTNEVAEAMEDAKFAGRIDDSGLFMPAVAGPNPERPFTTNNAGDLKITAEAMGVTGEAQLIVTVQRFIDPPIR